jgi:hypothetical protein
LLLSRGIRQRAGFIAVRWVMKFGRYGPF